MYYVFVVPAFIQAHIYHIRLQSAPDMLLGRVASVL